MTFACFFEVVNRHRCTFIKINLSNLSGKAIFQSLRVFANQNLSETIGFCHYEEAAISHNRLLGLGVKHNLECLIKLSPCSKMHQNAILHQQGVEQRHRVIFRALHIFVCVGRFLLRSFVIILFEKFRTLCSRLSKTQHRHPFGQSFIVRKRHHHIVHHIHSVSGKIRNTAFAELMNLCASEKTFEVNAKVGCKSRISIRIFVTLHLSVGELTTLQELRHFFTTCIERSTTMLIDERMRFAIKVEILL